MTVNDDRQQLQQEPTASEAEPDGHNDSPQTQREQIEQLPPMPLAQRLVIITALIAICLVAYALFRYWQ